MQCSDISARKEKPTDRMKQFIMEWKELESALASEDKIISSLEGSMCEIDLLSEQLKYIQSTTSSNSHGNNWKHILNRWDNGPKFSTLSPMSLSIGNENRKSDKISPNSAYELGYQGDSIPLDQTNVREIERRLTIVEK